MTRLTIAAVVVAAAAYGQQAATTAAQTAATQPPGIVAGKVISAITGESLRKTTVTLRPSSQGRGGFNATTDNNGEFQITGVDPGRYSLYGERTGYVRSVHPDWIDVVSSETAHPSVLKMTPQSVVTGKITDDDGDVVEAASVEIWQVSYPRGKRQLASVDQVSANDQGEYRIAGLLPGRYYVTASKNGRGPGGGGGRGRGGNQSAPALDYVTTFYPGSTDFAGAAALDITAGLDARGFDIRLAKSRLFTVSGVVSGLPAPSNPAPSNNAQGDQGGGTRGRGGQGGPGGRGGGQVNLVARDPLAPRNAQRNAPIAADGTFEIRGVAPGSYFVAAQAPGATQQRLQGRTPVDVSRGDANGIALRLNPPASATGMVTVDGDAPPTSLSSIRINFAPVEAGGYGGGGGGGGGNTQVKADGSFTTNIAADAYGMEISGLPQGYYVKSIRVSGRDAPDGQIDFSLPQGPIGIVVASGGATLSGTVLNPKGDPQGDVKVTMVPDDASPRRDLYKSANTDTNGAFSFSGLAPGVYKILAWEEVETNAWMDAGFRVPFDAWAARVRVDASSSPTATINMIPRDQLAKGIASIR